MDRGDYAIYAFFASLRNLALGLSLLMFLTKRTPATITLLVANAVVTLPVAFVMLRRTDMAEVGIVVLSALWFARRIQVPRLALVVAGLAFAAVVFAIGPLRAASNTIYEETGQRPWIFSQDVWRQVDLSFTVGTNVELAPDMHNAAQLIGLVDGLGMHAYGGVTWDGLVQQWVPGQILGAEFKHKLMVGTHEIFDRVEETNGYQYQIGTTSTGLGSAYYDFGLFGAVYFAAFGYVAGFFYSRGVRGDPWSQALYMASAVLILISFTHSHDLFIAILPLSLLAVAMLRGVLWFTQPGRSGIAAAPRPREDPAPAAPPREAT